LVQAGPECICSTA